MSDALLPVSAGTNTAVFKRLKDMGDGTFAEVVSVAAGGAASIARAGKSLSGSVGVSGTDVVAAAGAFVGEATVQNKDTSKTLYLSFTSPVTAADFEVGPKAALTLPFGPTNILYGLGSAAATTFAVIGA